MSDRSKKLSKLLENSASRASYIRAKLNINLPSQIRGIRRHREWTQQELAQIAEMKQARISAIESPGAVKFNIETLIRLAAAFRVGLQVKFVPFSEMLRWENGFSQDAFDVTTIENDAEFLYPAAEAASNSAAQIREEAVLATASAPYQLTCATSDRPERGALYASDFLTNLFRVSGNEASPQGSIIMGDLIRNPNAMKVASAILVDKMNAGKSQETSALEELIRPQNENQNIFGMRGFPEVAESVNASLFQQINPSITGAEDKQYNPAA